MGVVPQDLAIYPELSARDVGQDRGTSVCWQGGLELAHAHDGRSAGVGCGDVANRHVVVTRRSLPSADGGLG